jgi:hypothetical protein
MNDQAEEVSVEELFRELCVRGRDYVTVKDIKKWDYLQELMKVSHTILLSSFPLHFPLFLPFSTFPSLPHPLSLSSCPSPLLLSLLAPSHAKALCFVTTAL